METNRKESSKKHVYQGRIKVEIGEINCVAKGGRRHERTMNISTQLGNVRRLDNFLELSPVRCVINSFETKRQYDNLL